MVKRGRLLQVQCVFLDQTKKPMKVGTIYMRIQDADGIIVYRTMVMARDRAGFVIDIATAEFDYGQYVLHISNHIDFSPIATASFTVTGEPKQEGLLGDMISGIIARVRHIVVPRLSQLGKRIQGAPIVPLLPAEDDAHFLISGDVRFQTEEDARVCQICEPHNAEVYDSEDPEKPTIPLHPRCRCWYEYIDTDEHRPSSILNIQELAELTDNSLLDSPPLPEH
jgi:hypothetical protein